jgi:hypothetical protein
MTSQGSAMMRFERALAIGRPSIVIAAAHELPKPILPRDALRILLVLIAGEPDRFPAAAARYGARLATERQLTLAEAQLAYTALTMLSSPEPGAAGAALETLLEHHGEHEAAEHLADWLRRREA